MRNLIGFLRHWFVAHPGNDHRPHVLRKRALAVILAVVVLSEGLALVQTSGVVGRSGFLGEILSTILVSQTNGHRVEASLGTLRPNPLLEAAAAAKAADMAAKGYFAHTSPEGLTPWYWLENAGYAYAYAGENLAVNFTESKDVTDAWMNSPGHRANILNQRFTEIGIATARGMYEGKEVVFVVEMFGAPARATAPAAVVAQPPQETRPPAVVTPQPKPLPPPVVPRPTTPVVPAPLPVEKENFAVVEIPGATPPEVLSATPPSFKQRVLSAAFGLVGRPVDSADSILLFFALLIGAALLVKLLRVGMLHPRLVMNGLAVLLLFVAIASLNHYLPAAETLVP